MTRIPLVETSVVDLSSALADGRTTAVEIVTGYLERIDAYDRSGPTLNAYVVMNPDALDEARASDERRARGEALGPLDGIPYAAKDSYMVRGLTVASGSPAFADLVAQRDAFTVERLRAAGAICLGLTNMPPMANGGMQRGLYGRAESPYNPDYLTAPFGSGSSNGSGSALAASLAAFALAEETWSSGRGPASNNGLVCYTPSRGVISVRGNWPLVPTMDVVVPYTRTVVDLLVVLDAIVADDPETRGDFWRVQPWVTVPAASSVRPASYPALAGAAAGDGTAGLAGRRLGVPKLYIGGDDASGEKIATRASVIDQWRAVRRDLEAAGAEVVEVDFPVVTNYESRGRTPDRSLVARGYVPEGFADSELYELSMWGWEEFLQANGDPALHRLADVEPSLIFPEPPGALPGQYDDHLSRFAPEDVDLADYVHRAREHGVPALDEIPHIAEGAAGLERARRELFEAWLDEQGLDAIAFPAVADVGPADADVNPESAERAWRNGTWVANGNLVPRHLGIPAVQVPIGVMSDIGMPVGLTIAGRAYDDSALLRYAAAMEATANREGSAVGRTRRAPARTPELG
ncbi:amidase [Microcella putealis]|uniref:Amidase n=1 Tax=Microcella putealis TaxID=337005 RepID=A0A4Q7LXK3_9MICO|nr:amidase [Microcella putealis]RZS59736.1 amidase [Microcella putealis]TQM26849.1 amidase [Microcella putealis]